MRWSSSLAFVVVTFALPAAARAQEGTLLPSRPVVLTASPGELSTAERRELDAWLKSVRNWQRDDKRWHNEPAHDPFGRIVNRAPRPEPPSWLESRCAPYPSSALLTLAGPIGPACRVLAGLDEDAAAGAIRTSTAATRSASEKRVKNTFLTRVHLDGLWTTTSTDYRLYGLVGSHISLVDVGRVQFFGPPGVILLSVPNGRGGREMRTGYTWGLSVRLNDMRLFSPTKNMTLFLTVTKVWVAGGNTYERLGPGGYDIAGFSLAPRRHILP
jgi:hypothetical protein